MSPDRRAPWSTRAFRALLSLYPGEFRDEYGREVAMVFTDRYRDAAPGWPRARVWLDAAAGVLKEAPKEHLQVIVHDLRFAARMVHRSPGFAATVVLTLALGIGANTAIFQLINAVRLRSLPIRHPASWWKCASPAAIKASASMPGDTASSRGRSGTSFDRIKTGSLVSSRGPRAN